MRLDTLTLRGFFLRLAAATCLVGFTYNPSGHSYIHWLRTTLPSVSPMQAVVGLLLIGAWGFFAMATWRSLGTIGLLFGAALTAAIIWLMTSWGWFTLENTSVVSWLVLASLAIFLAIGVSWSFVRKGVTGQTDVDEVDRH
jgi:hypothetical protein